jgi:sugar lactone lactonase YvrE
MVHSRKKRSEILILSLSCVVSLLFAACNPILDENSYNAKVKADTPRAAPSFSPPAGSYETPQSVTISTASAGAAIRFTTDGTIPTSTAGIAYAGPILVSSNQTIAAIAYDSGAPDSPVATASYTIGVAKPTFNPPAGSYDVPQTVSISTATSAASIRYTVDGITIPTETVGTPYTGPISVSTGQTIRAIAYKSGCADSVVAEATYEIQVAAPTFTPPAGSYDVAQNVNINTTTSGASIRYSTGATDPTETIGTAYTGPVSVTSTETIRAIAYKAGSVSSTVETATYTIQAVPPTFNPPGGSYSADQMVTIITTTSGSTIHYTTDGSLPTVSSTLYAGPVSVVGNGVQVTIKAIATKGGIADSSPATAAYSISYPKAAAPTFSPVSGTYQSDQLITVSCVTSGVSIYYSIDGSIPTSSSNLYSSAIAVTGNGTNKTIKAIATKAGMTDSAVASASYVIIYQAATPTFNPVGGTYSSDQSVTISCATPGASIYYTTDGSTPTNASNPYSAPVPVAGNGVTMTIKAIATKAGGLDSLAATSTFVISYPKISPPPTFSPAAGTYTSDQSVTISCSTPGAAIHYTTDGSAPTASSATYAAPVAVAGNGATVTVRAIATKSGMTSSDASSAAYTMYDTWRTFGTYGNGTNQFASPVQTALDSSGRIYIADTYNNRIVRMDDMNGTNWTAFGSQGSGTNQFWYPSGIAVDSSNRIYICDQRNSRIVRMDDMSGTNWTSFGSAGTGINQFTFPEGIALDSSGKIYIADAWNNRIVRMNDMSGNFWTTLGSLGQGVNQYNRPMGIAVDPSGHIYVADDGGMRITRMDDMNGANWVAFGSNGSGLNQFQNPSGVAVGTDGRIYIVDTGNNRIVRVNDMNGSGWAALGTRGNGINQFSLDGTYPAPTLGASVGTSGRVYVPDFFNGRIASFVIP